VLVDRLEQLFDRPQTGRVTFSQLPQQFVPGEDVVTARGLTRQFGSFTAVNDVSFAIKTGEIFGLVGPNGSGKTTIIRMLCGIIPPTSGAIRVAGCDVVSDWGRVKTRIGYMSQRFSLYRDLTVDENIRFFGRVYGLNGAQLEERRAWALQFSDLERHQRSLTGELSAALTQRLALACALLHKPPVVFLDEPTSGVDPASRSSFWKIISELARTGTSILVTTHHLEEAEHCHRVAFMHGGRLLAVENPAALRGRHAMKSMEDIFVDLIEAAA
jgi:ABC-2 type transport system ATP-binding protein